MNDIESVFEVILEQGGARLLFTHKEDAIGWRQRANLWRTRNGRQAHKNFQLSLSHEQDGWVITARRHVVPKVTLLDGSPLPIEEID